MLLEIESVTDKTSFNSYEDFDTHPVAEISCPKCPTKTNISLSDLRKHQHTRHSNLSDEVSSRLILLCIISLSIEFLKVNGLTNSYLDYYCPNCNAGIRILYEAWAGGKHGEYGFELKNIITD